MTSKQCGVCSQCIERRFAVLAAGLEDEEPSDSYAINLFTGAHTRAIDITMAEQHVSRAERFTQMSEQAFLGSYGQVFRTLPHLPGDPSANAARIFQLHRRYGQGIMAVVNTELRRHAEYGRVLELAPTSLLAMIGSPSGALAPIADPTEREPRPSEQAAFDKGRVKERRFAFAIDEIGKKVIFDDGPVLTGAYFGLICFLAEQFREDIRGGRVADSYTYVRTPQLLTALKLTDHSLTQRVSRLRKTLRQQFISHIDYTIDDHDIVQSGSWMGYRLNPYLILVELSQLRSREVS